MAAPASSAPSFVEQIARMDPQRIQNMSHEIAKYIVSKLGEESVATIQALILSFNSRKLYVPPAARDLRPLIPEGERNRFTIELAERIGALVLPILATPDKFLAEGLSIPLSEIGPVGILQEMRKTFKVAEKPLILDMTTVPRNYQVKLSFDESTAHIQANHHFGGDCFEEQRFPLKSE